MSRRCRTAARRGALPALAALAALAAGLPGCATRSARDVVHRDPDLEISLRREVRWFQPVDKGYDHPLEISPRRLAHILASIDVETREDGATTLREPAFATEILPDVAEGLSRALQEADSSQQVVVKALRKARRLGLFHRKYLTSFIAYGKGDLLFLRLRRVNWKVPKRDEERDRIPEPWINRREMEFEVKQAEGMRVVGRQDLAVSWRDPVFSVSRRLRTGEGGQPKRRTILMEEEVPEGEARVPRADEIENLSPEALRALADLEEQRRSGAITESEYQARRYEILAREGPEKR